MLRITSASMILFKASLILCVLAGCFGPQRLPDGIGPKPASLDLYEKIRANPKHLELYPKFIQMQFAAADFEGVDDSVAFCLEHNRSDYRAWLLKADTEQRLAAVGKKKALVQAEQALLQAHRLSAERSKTAMALASFYAASWQKDKEKRYWEEVLATAQDSDKEQARVALALFHYNHNNLNKAKSLLVQASEKSFVAWKLGLQIHIEEKGVDESLLMLGELSQHEPLKRFNVLLRLVSLVTSPKSLDILGAEFRRGLQEYETPKIRFLCLLGLWQVGWVRETLREGARGVPPDNDQLATRLDQIDSYHPQWLQRAAMVEHATNSKSAQGPYIRRLDEMLVASAPLFLTIEDVLSAWAMEDTLALGMPRLAAQISKKLYKHYSQNMALKVAAIGVMMEADYVEQAIDLMDKNTTETDQDKAQVVKLLLWQAQIRVGQAQQIGPQIEGELKTQATTNPGREALFRLMAIVELYGSYDEPSPE